MSRILFLPLRVLLSLHFSPNPYALAYSAIILLLCKPVRSWKSSYHPFIHKRQHVNLQDVLYRQVALHQSKLCVVKNRMDMEGTEEQGVQNGSDESERVGIGETDMVQWPYSLELLDPNVALVPQIQYPLDYEENSEQNERLKMLIMVDVFSPYHGNYLSQRARSVYGCAVCNVLSSYLCGYLVQESSSSTTFNDDDDDDDDDAHDLDQQRIQYLEARIPCSQEEAYTWLSQLPPFVDIVGIHCESDSGLEDAEKFGDWIRSFQLQQKEISSDEYFRRYNSYNPARRDKFQMIQKVNDYSSSATMQQCLCSSMEEAIEFFNQVEGSVVLKPIRGVVSFELFLMLHCLVSNNGNLGLHSRTFYLFCCQASDGVHLCHSRDEIMEAFQKVHRSPVFGSLFQTNEDVLIQQYIGGTEYAVDVVSRAGQHKVAAVYQYDKRPANGGPFVYFATKLADLAKDEGAKSASEYVMRQVLPALDFQWGLTHTEVKVLNITAASTTSSGYECQLIEVNCRQHNTDFAPMTDICIGYNALDMLLAGYLDPPSTRDTAEADEGVLPLPSWDSFPTYPSLRLQGYIVHLVCHVCGEVQEIQHMDVIEDLPSFATMELYPKFFPPSHVTPTVDIRSDAGWIHLINDDPSQIQSDYETIVNLMPTMFRVA
jgi:hypothetical protein